MYLFEELRELKLSERRAKIAMLLEKYDYMGYIPRGCWQPGFGHWPDLREVQGYHETEQKIWVELKRELPKLLEAELPKIFTTMYERWQRNRDYMIMLTEMDQFERQDLNVHQFPPFHEDFNSAIQDRTPYLLNDLDIMLKDITFTTELIGSGGLADIYKAVAKDGRVFALKLFRPLCMYSYGLQDRKRCIYRGVLENVQERRKLFSPPFIQPLMISSRSPSLEWYLMDFIPGETMRARLEASTPIQADNTTIRAIATYANMLGLLHKQDLVFVDNNWGAVIVNDDETRICDVDMISSVDEMQTEGYYARRFHNLAYASREQLDMELPFVKSSDLEGFALMLDYFYFGNHMLSIDWDDREVRGIEVEKATTNKREYPRVRAERVPKNLREIITGLLTYPRDDSITASDVQAAIKLDYKV